MSDQKQNEGYRELQRLFGSGCIEEGWTHQTNLSGPHEGWYYVVTLDGNHPLLHSPLTRQWDMDNVASNIEDALFNTFNLSLTPWIVSNRLESRPDANILHALTAQQHPQNVTIKLCLRADEIEEPENVSILKNISQDAIKHALLGDITDDLHNQYADILRRASHGIRWKFVSDREGEYFMTTTPLKRSPSALELAILSRLNLTDDRLMPPIDGVARIPLACMLEGNRGNLMENPVPYLSTSVHLKSRSSSNSAGRGNM